jgi:predicted nucleotidyltransferase
MTDDLTAWSAKLASWAGEKPQIAELWLFGSRVRGTHREDSDLDVAVIMSGSSQGVRYGNWLALADAWKRELGELLPVPIDLDIGDSDIAVNVVAPAVRCHGIQIFRRRT